MSCHYFMGVVKGVAKVEPMSTRMQSCMHVGTS
jgi:hypothetical protein